eukprot:1193536-Prorocentrum_minimum.AAC.1
MIFRNMPCALQVGARTVAIYSPPDRLQPHRYKADESYCVGENTDYTPVGCYLVSFPSETYQLA